MKIYLSYGIWESGSIQWQEPPVGFEAVTIVPTKKVKRIAGYDLRDKPYSHLHSSRPAWDLVISADELTDSQKRNFLHELFNADEWRYGTESFYYGYGMGYGYVDVFLLDHDVLPETFLEDNLSLPEIVFRFEQKEPD